MSFGRTSFKVVQTVKYVRRVQNPVPTGRLVFHFRDDHGLQPIDGAFNQENPVVKHSLTVNDPGKAAFAHMKVAREGKDQRAERGRERERHKEPTDIQDVLLKVKGH